MLCLCRYDKTLPIGHISFTHTHRHTHIEGPAVCTSMMWGTAAPLVGCLPAARQKACRFPRNRKSFPLQRAMLSRRSTPSTHAPVLTRPLSAARRPRRFRSVYVAEHWRPYESTTRGVKSQPPGLRKAYLPPFSLHASPQSTPQWQPSPRMYPHSSVSQRHRRVGGGRGGHRGRPPCHQMR